MRALALPMILFLSGCQYFADGKHVLKDISKAQAEMAKTFGVPVSIHLNAEDLEAARTARVTLARKPAGLSKVQIERNVNIVVHRYIPRIETIEVIVPD